MSDVEHIVDFEDAIRIVLDHAVRVTREGGIESVPLLEAHNRVLATGVEADRDQPPFDRSTRDGFAIQCREWKPDATLKVMGQLRAGEPWRGGHVEPGTAIEIMTGAAVPEGANAVIMLENVRRTGDLISPGDGRSVQPGENIVPRAREAHQGTEILHAGTRIGAAEIALAANCGCAQLDVFELPQVAIVATGDELVELDQQPGPQQIRNSNSYAIAAMVNAAGGRPLRLPIARDLRDEIHSRIADARACGLMVLSGGVSMGEYDLVEEALTGFGAEFFFTGVRMQPGKPVVFGRLRASPEAGEPCYLFGLPGNPISTQVTFHCFAEPFLRVLSGEANVAPRWALATLAEAIQAKPGLTRLLPARIDGTAVKVVAWQGSGDLAANARANCYAEFLPGRAYSAGEVIRVLLR
jgi:molybdopterin molybdotransferase